MDGLSDDANEPKHVYRLHDKQNSFAVALMCTDAHNIINNNNNNVKMDEDNKTENVIEPNGRIELPLPRGQPTVAAAIQCRNDENAEHSDNDNQSNGSDDNSDNNSTDNISFVSDDLVDNIIILPGNFLSDDEQSTNSDDCVYAYRGGGGDGGFEPIADDADNADDETDYLEMDFEPDPVSEMEREADFRASAAANFGSPNAASLPASSESSSAVLQPDVRHSRSEAIKRPAEQLALDSPTVSLQGNDSATRCCCDTADCECSRMRPSTSSDNVPLAETSSKYTGTIPKTLSRYQYRAQRAKPSTSTASCSSESGHVTANQNGSAKRCENRQPSSSDGQAIFSGDIGRNFKREHPMASTSRSMSFPGESFLNRTDSNVSEPSCDYGDNQGGDVHRPKRTLRSNSCLAINDLVERNRSSADDQAYSVSFFSYECSVESLLVALERMNVTTDAAKLEEAFRITPSVDDMDIIQYLTHMSKQTCNYKRILAAIKQCCENVSVDFYPGTDDFLEGVQVPLREIFQRLPASGDLKSILTIKNKRFHQMNVFGKIVSAIRRYPDMRADMINDDYIVIPQYYRSGCIVIQKI